VMWERPNEPPSGTLPTSPTQDLSRGTYRNRGGTGDDFTFVDGGNGGLGSPALFATIEETDASRGRKRLLLSLGTGHYEKEVSEQVREGGFLQWLLLHGDLLRNVFDGEADVTDMVLSQMPEQSLDYFRWQPDIDESLDFLDEGSKSDMKSLENVARSFIADNDEAIDDLVEVLVRPRLARAS
jgi:hypothetical protein